MTPTIRERRIVECAMHVSICGFDLLNGHLRIICIGLLARLIEGWGEGLTGTLSLLFKIDGAKPRNILGLAGIGSDERGSALFTDCTQRLHLLHTLFS